MQVFKLHNVYIYNPLPTLCVTVQYVGVDTYDGEPCFRLLDGWSMDTPDTNGDRYYKLPHRKVLPNAILNNLSRQAATLLFCDIKEFNFPLIQQDYISSFK